MTGAVARRGVHERRSRGRRGGRRGQPDQTLPAGDRVVVNIMAAVACGRCHHCLGGDPKYCRESTSLGGPHCQYVAVTAAACLPLPHGIAFDTGVLLGGDFVGSGYRTIKWLGVLATDTVLVL